jgi:hypothetical protein
LFRIVHLGFITAGAAGRSFEVTPGGEIVWEYWTPYHGNITNPDGSPRSVANNPYAAFRMTFISTDHPAFEDRDLTPIDPQPEPYLTELPKPKKAD